MIELVQGEGGVMALNHDFVRKTEEFCRENDILLIVDEVQTGNGRTGSLYALSLIHISQPVTLAHHMLAYCAMLMRDFDRLEDCKKRMSVMPLGSCAVSYTHLDVYKRQIQHQLQPLYCALFVKRTDVFRRA